MSSCFLCDCSYVFKVTGFATDIHYVHYQVGPNETNIARFMKQLPIMNGSSGLGKDDQQHNNNNKQNYVSYKVKKLEFFCSFRGDHPNNVHGYNAVTIPDYILIFKVPFREPIFNYDFRELNKFMLFSEPECVLDYKLFQDNEYTEMNSKNISKVNININKPFIVGPNDYVGVFYMFTPPVTGNYYVDASARVWFDIL